MTSYHYQPGLTTQLLVRIWLATGRDTFSNTVERGRFSREQLAEIQLAKKEAGILGVTESALIEETQTCSHCKLLVCSECLDTDYQLWTEISRPCPCGAPQMTFLPSSRTWRCPQCDLYVCTSEGVVTADLRELAAAVCRSRRKLVSVAVAVQPWAHYFHSNLARKLRKWIFPEWFMTTDRFRLAAAQVGLGPEVEIWTRDSNIERW